MVRRKKKRKTKEASVDSIIKAITKGKRVVLIFKQSSNELLKDELIVDMYLQNIAMDLERKQDYIV